MVPAFFILRPAQTAVARAPARSYTSIRSMIQHGQAIPVRRQREVAARTDNRFYQQSQTQAPGSAVQHAQHLVLYLLVIDRCHAQRPGD